ncbi:hypothetical protein EJ08DRAFT_652921 [Tothia fuscella]|uniref:Uncharacterized protein n=1 Tax=Tothia fuscella TaxID=1048955 RepID=A0A9P4NIT9_9PEZI|nr:hypothetical protein EJ08DRAFT_652921 [Tothia fuscella]
MSSSLRSQSPPRSVRTASAGGTIHLAHPTPDLQSLQGAYVQNVERLEERAERMSIGSDIGEEIRKLQQEQKLSDSRRSSILSNTIEEQHHPRSRNLSTGSWANSIVEVNSAARNGGYSPAGFIGSPIGSLRSGSWSQVSYSASARSMTKGPPRLGMVFKHEFGGELIHSPIDDSTVNSAPGDRTPQTLSHSSFSDLDDATPSASKGKRVSRLPSDGSFTNLYNQMTEANGSATHLAAARIPSDTSFTDIYDQIAGEIHSHLESPTRNEKGLSASPWAQQSFEEDMSRQLNFDFTSAKHEDETAKHNSSAMRNCDMPTISEDDLFNRLREEAEEDHPEQDPESANYHALSDQGQLHAVNEPYDRPATSASTDTYRQAQSLFRDFDGAHYEPSIRESIMEDMGESEHHEDMRQSSLLRTIPYSEPRVPPPGDGMVYYPAPVPRMLNLPQRLSQAPSAAIQAKRRTQLLQELPPDQRKSAPWLMKEQRGSEGGMSDLAGLRDSKMNLAALPPQLRASMFFEHTAQRQEVEMQGSAMATFEDLLDASANAPVSAFTDHPIVGKAGAGIYKKDAGMRSSISLTQVANHKKEKSRSSFLGLRRSSISSNDALERDGAKTPSGFMRRSSRGLSMKLDDSALNRGPDGEILGPDAPRKSRDLDDNGQPFQGEVVDAEDEGLEDEEDEDNEEEGGEGEEEYFGPPTTLLAELQLRKAEQKNRNRNAFTSFPNGMHSTLLEMDAVAQLEKKKRKNARVALAWEDPSVREAENAAGNDDNVPLGLLFANKSSQVKNALREQGLADWDRPLGLLEKRQLEDNEPLSKRRNRLLGIPNAPRVAPSVFVSVAEDAEAGAESDSEHEGETLKDRIQRLKDKKALDEASRINDGNRPISTAFSVELMGQFGLEDPERKTTPLSRNKTPLSEKAVCPVPTRSGNASPAEDETLGQRRARLKREALAATRSKSPMTLGPDSAGPVRRQTPLSLDPNNLGPTRRQSQMSLGPETLTRRQSQMTLSPSPDAMRSSMYLPNDMAPQPEQRPPMLRNQSSLADLLANNPIGQHDARKVSNELLVASLPPGSLLAQQEEKTQGFRAHIQNTNRRSSGLMLDGQDQRPGVERRKSSGFRGGMFNTGAGAVGANQEVPHLQPNYGMPAAPSPYNPMSMAVYPSNGMNNMNMSNTFAMSSPNLGMMNSGGGMQMYPPMPTYPQMGGGFNPMSNPNLLASMQGFGGMSNPNLMSGGMNYHIPAPVQYPPQQRTNTFSGMGLPHLKGQRVDRVMVPEVPIDSKTRDRVDAWRQGVMP